MPDAMNKLRAAVARGGDRDAEARLAELGARLDALEHRVAQLADAVAADRASNAEAHDRMVSDLQRMIWDLGERANANDVRFDALSATVGRLEAQATELTPQLRRLDAVRAPEVETLHLPPGTRRTLYAHEGDARGVICSRATGAYLELLAVTAPTFEAYARRWGWDVVVSAEDALSAGRPSSWGKLPLVRELAEHYDWVWWIDADAIVVDLEHDLGEHLGADHDLLVVEHEFTWDYGDGPQVHRFPNFGMFVLRGGAAGQAICDALWERDDLIDSPWWENTALLDLLGYELYPMRHERDTPLHARTGRLPRAWNSLDDLDEDPAPIICHHAGNAPFDERLRRTRVDFGRFRQALTGDAEH